MPFKIVIVGTGIAGLSAAIALAGKGHHVTVVEATSKLQAIGGIIIIQANANRVLDGLGIYESLLTICGTAPLSLGARRYSDGELLFTQPAGAHGDEYGYPIWSVHRADLQQVLYQAAVKHGINLRLGCAVVSVDDENPAVVIKGGERIPADIIVGADGIKSVVRKCTVPDSAECVRDSGLDVTRVNIPEAIVRSDPEISIFMEQVNMWFGPATTITAVPIRRGNEWLLGVDFIHRRDENSADGVSKPQNISMLREYFKGHAPSIQKLLSYVKEAHVWRIAETMPESWVSKGGKVVLVGDAAHAVLPYAGQGGCIAIEDAVTLAECLERAETTDDIPKVLKSYQEIRGPRCNLVQEWSAIQCKRATMPDGPEQEQRDKNFKSANHWAKAEPWDGVHVDEPPPIDDSTWYAWLCGHDTVVFANRELDKRFGARH